MNAYNEDEIRQIRENCSEYKKVGCCGENLPKDFPAWIECPDNETCPASTK
jgi:hypothetical protein